LRARWWTPLFVLVLAVLVGAGVVVKRRFYPAAELRLVYRVVLEPGAGERRAALERMVRGVRRRAEGLCHGVRVKLRGEQIQIDLPHLSGRALKTFERRIKESVRFELRRVDDSSETLPRMITAVPPPEGVEVKRNDYDTPDGRTVRYVTLASPNRRELEHYLEGTPAELKPPPEREILFGEGFGPHGRLILYELYLVQRRPELTGRDIARARAFRDGSTGRYEVSVTFTARGGQRFERLTRQMVGRRLAIVLDGQVSSAPVVQAAIPGGRARISPGGFKDPTTERIEAEELASALEAGALPGKLEPLRTERLR
jgi:preprotein translocase subunit SecD